MYIPKCERRSVVGATDCPNTSRRLFITDRTSGRKYLIDTGSDLSILPRNSLRCCRPRTAVTLTAANNTEIPTYGTRCEDVNLGLRRQFTWNFTVADVAEAIIGADFLAHFKLLPDIANARLVDGVTGLNAAGYHHNTRTSSIKLVQVPDEEYRAILQDFPALTRPPGAPQQVLHDTVHYIKTTDGPPVSCRPRKLAPGRLSIAKAEFDLMLKEGIIRPSSSPWASALHLVPKKGGAWRPCGDYRALNARTIPDRYPVPLLRDYNHALHGATIFSVIDCAKAYTQIPVAPEDIPKTAIITPFGLFESKFMTFGLRNAAQTWQRFIDNILRGLPFCFAYLDDVLVFSETKEQHHQHLREVFKCLEKHGVVLNTAKCVFGQPEVEFLGHRISSAGSAPLPDKVEAILQLPKPTTVKELRRYLGMLNFYRRHLPRTAEQQAPLNAALTGAKVRGNAPVKWNESMDAAFEATKNSLAQAALLAHPKLEAPLALVVDASQIAIGAALQQWVDDAWQPLAYFSHKLTPSQQRWSAYDRELLAIYQSIKHFRSQVEARNFTVFTDHKPLVYAFQKNSDKCSPRQYSQLEFISQFTTDLQHISGMTNVVADCLSRISSISQPLNMTELAIAQQKDAELQAILQDDKASLKLQLVDIPGETTKIYCDVQHGRSRPFVPTAFRRKVFDNLHNLCHPGVRATTKLVSQRFVWPNMDRDCRQWTRACPRCQLCKVTRHVHAPVGDFPDVSARFAHIHLDVVGPLPPSDGHRYLMTMIDRYTRWPEAVPINDISAETLAAAFTSTWLARFGCPLHITTDRGRQFESELFTQLARFCGYVHHKTTAYHPASNGMLERWHRTLKAALMCHGTTWTSALPIVLLGLRTTFKPDIEASAAELVYGESLRLPGEFIEATKIREIEDQPQFLRTLRETVDRIKPVRASRHGKSMTFVHKDLDTCTHVMLRTDAVKPPLQPPYTGPHRVLCRSLHTMDILVNGKQTTVSISRVKPAYMFEQTLTAPSKNAMEETEEPTIQPPTPPPPQPLQEEPRRTTRSGRHVHFPARFREDIPRSALAKGAPIATVIRRYCRRRVR